MKTVARFLFVWIAAIVAATTARACFAQGTAPAPEADPTAVAGQVYNALLHKHWALAAVAAIILLCGLLKWGGSKLPGKAGAFFASTNGGMLLAFLSAGAVVLSTAAAAGQPITFPLVTAAFNAGLMAIGGWHTIRNLTDKKPNLAGAEVSPIPPPIRPGALLPFLLFASAIGMLVAPGCGPAGKAYGLSYAACMKAKGLQAVGTVEQDVSNIMQTGVTQPAIVGALEGLAGQAGVDATICAVQAWLSPAHPASLKPSAVDAAKAFLAHHGVKA